jgi:hypothetical protein
MPERLDDAAGKRARVTRRGLLGRGGGAALGGAVAASAGEAKMTEQVDPKDDPRRVTYRETDHIRAYYRRSRI